MLLVALASLLPAPLLAALMPAAFRKLLRPGAVLENAFSNMELTA